MFDNWTYEEKVSFVTRIITGEATSEELVAYEEWSQDPENKQTRVQSAVSVVLMTSRVNKPLISCDDYHD